MEIFIVFKRYNIVFLILVLHGIGVLMPWNMFITAHAVSNAICQLAHKVILCSFQYFVDYKLNVTIGDLVADASTAEHRKNFLSYLGVAAQVPNVACNALNLFIQST